MPLLLIWFAVLAGAVVLSVLAAREARLPGDLAITQAVQGWPFPGDALSDVIRAVTTTEVVLGVGFALAAVLWLAGARREAVLLAIGLAVLPFLQSGIKELVDRPRPTPDVVELRAADTPGLLFRVTAALEACGADVRWARVSTLGGDVVDAFGLASVPERSLVTKALTDATG